MNRIPNPASLPNNNHNSEHEQRIAAIREKAQRHAQRSARLFAPSPEAEGSDLPVPTLLAVACSVALANHATQAQATPVNNGADFLNALSNGHSSIELTQDISITNERAFTHNNINIDGEKHTVFLNKNQALWNSGDVRNIGNISNITFKNGEHFSSNNSNGGVIDLYGSGGITGNITESHFENSHVANWGGAIYSNTIDGSIKNSSFVGNSAGNWNTAGSGGALHIINDIGNNIEVTRFENNNAQHNGGAVFANNIQGTILDSQFINNKSTNSHGGALYIVKDIKGGISGGIFKDNSAGGARGGGAVSVGGSIDNGIQGATFENNEALSIDISGGGGAIRSSVINGGISGNTIFKENTAATGGAIFLSNGSNGMLYGGIDNSKFIGNTATHSGGGAIHLHDGTLQGGIKNRTEFTNNTANNYHGGAIWTSHIQDGISDSTFSGNKTLTGYGGAIAAEKTISGSITDSTFKENTAYTSAGALYAQSFNGHIDNSTFSENTATTSGGGAIHIYSTLSGDIKNNSQFIDNTAKTHGGAIWLTKLEGNIIDAEFINNIAQNGSGGAISAVNITGSIQGSIFKNNKSEGVGNNGGGAIHLSNGTLHGGIKNDTVFEGNIARGSGGAIWVNTINNGISEAKFIGNKSLNAQGGAIAAEHKITGGITDSFFSKNSSGLHGGAIKAGNSSVATGIEGGIINSTFEENQSDGVGGAIIAYVYEGGIDRSHFIKNISGSRGGALDSSTWINDGIKNSVFSDNISNDYGGAIHANDGISGGIVDTRFEKNTSTNKSGGAINTGGFGGVHGEIKGDINRSTFSENTANIDGGAISSHTISGNIVDSDFIGNIATATHARGGGIFAHTIAGNITGGTFSGNKANAKGGGIYTTGDIDGSITGVEFKNNTATTEHGGAIWANSITGDISSTFFGNTAGVHGGALYFLSASGNNSIVNSSFSKNTAGDMGGAVFQETGGTLNVSDSRFLENIAQAGGGAIKTGGALNIKNSEFIGNQGVDNTMTSATGLGTGLGGAVLIQGQLDIKNSVFLGNTSAHRGAAVHHHHDLSGNTQTIRITGGANKTLFYGNQETDSGRYSSIEFSLTRNNITDVTIHTDNGVLEGNSGVLMFDAMQSVGGQGAALNITKTGAGDWFLGGNSTMVANTHPTPHNLFINDGRLALTDVDYDGTGAQQAQINLTNGNFTLANGAVLEGRGTISSAEINLRGTINPNVWRNTGLRANEITTGITQAEMDGIKAEKETTKNEFAILTLDTQGSGNAVNMDGATYEVGVAWKDNGSGGFSAQSDLLDIKGELKINNSGINITRLDFDEDWALARIQGGGTEPAATVIQTTDGISGDFKVQVAGTLAPDSDFLKVRGEQSGNNYEVKLGLSWYSKERDGSRTSVSHGSVLDAHGGFTIDTGHDFTLDGALTKRTDAPNFQDETSELGGAAGWDGNSLVKRGDGTLILNADNTYDGLTTIEAGKLILGNSASKASARVGGDVQVNNGAIFDGYGTAKGNVMVDNGGQFTGFGGAEGLVHIKNGGLLAPGNAVSMGTVNAGSLQMDAGSTLRIKTDSTGGADLVNVANDVTLNGGVVDVRAKDGNWGKRGTGHRRSIIQAGGTLTGAFDNVTTDLAFLTPNLDYKNGQVILDLTRNSTKMQDIADDSTRNRISTAEGLAGLEASGANPTLMNELLGLNKDDVLRAFNSLSGEIYPTTSAVLLQSSRQLRTRINTRLTSNTQGTYEAPSFNAIRALGTGDTGTNTPVWVSAWGHNGNQGRTSNAARADISGNGVLVGMDNTDRPVAGGLHAGAMFGSESTKVQIADDRNSRSEVDSRSAGLYGGSNIGDTQWRGGLIYSHLNVETQRTVTVNSLTERLRAERKGKQMQAFAEISHNLSLSNRTSVAPWLNVAKVWQSLDATHEGTGATALEIEKQSTSATLASVGGRGLVNLGDGRTPISLYTDVGYQYVIDGRKVDSKHHFAGQPQDFAVRGTTLNDTLVGAVGVQLGISRNSALLVEYRGEFGSGQQQHVGNISYQMKF